MTAQQLKASILQLAVQGKLVPQDPNDEPAHLLLERIRKEKARLIKAGKAKKEKNPSRIFRQDNAFYEEVNGEVQPLDPPFDIPDSWEWVRLRSIVYCRGQVQPTTDFCYIDIGSIDNKNQRLSPLDNIIKPENAPSRARKLVSKGDILYSTVRPYLHNMCIVDREFPHIPIASTGFAVLTCHADLLNQFLFYYMMSPDFDTYANDSENSRGVAYPAINDVRLYNALIPLPPLGEQKRIVEAIERLLPYLKRYEEAEKQLTSLNASFPEALKKAILQEAVQGKLVPQDPADEPAHLLLERIRKEKARLIKAGKAKKEKNPSRIFRNVEDGVFYEKTGTEVRSLADELPFDIPDSWEWIRLKDLVHYSLGKTPPRKEVVYWDSGTFPWVSIADLVADGTVTETKECVSTCAAEHIFRGNISKAGTLLMSFKLTIGKVSLLGIDAFHNEAIISILPFVDQDRVTTLFLFAVLPLLSREGNTKSAIKGSTLNSDSLDALLIPLPPLGEQKRIVEKISELSPLLEQYARLIQEQLSLYGVSSKATKGNNTSAIEH